MNENCIYARGEEQERESIPFIMPIKELRHTSKISELAHREQEPIFITKNGYNDLVVMSSELYDSFVKTMKIDRAIYEAEKEVANGAESIEAAVVFEELKRKHFD